MVPAQPLRLITTVLFSAVLLVSVPACGPSKSPHMEEARSSHNKNVATYAAQQAHQNFKTGNLKGALKNIDHALSAEPSNPDHHVLRGRTLIEMSQLDSAMQCFRRALKLDPEHGDAHYYAGVTFQAWSADEEAYEEYTKAYETDTFNVDYLMAMIESLIALERTDDAMAAIEESLRYFEHNAALRRTQGHVSLMLNDPESAVEYFHKAMLLAPQEPTLIEDLAMAQYLAGQYAKADYYLERLLRDDDYEGREDLKHLRARCLVACDRLVEARFLYLELVEENTSTPEMWYELGNVAFQLGDTRRVQQVSARTISTWPNRYEGYLLRGMLAEQSGDRKAAINDYWRATQRNPKCGEAFLLLGLALEDDGQTDQARIAYQKARQSSGDEPDVAQVLDILEGGF